MPSSDGKIDMETRADPKPVSVWVKAEMSMTTKTMKNMAIKTLRGFYNPRKVPCESAAIILRVVPRRPRQSIFDLRGGMVQWRHFIDCRVSFMRSSRIAFILWLLSISAFVVAASQREVQLGALVLSTIVFALLMGLYLMFSDARIAEALPQFTRDGGEYGLPGFLFLLFVILALIARITNPVIAIVVVGATLWVPVGLWSRNEEALTPIQAVAGLAVLLIPLGVDVVLGARPDTTEILLRLGAFALPALLVLLTTREQKSRLNFYFASAVLFIWYTVEFGAAPDVGLPPAVARPRRAASSAI